MQSIIGKIREFGLSSSELSEKSGIDPVKISSILNGTTEPTLADIRKIARALHVAPSLLVNDDDKIPALGVLFRKSFSEQDGGKVSRLSFLLNNCLFLLDRFNANNSSLNLFPHVGNTHEGAKLLAQIFRQHFYEADFVSPILDLHDKIVTGLNCVIVVSDIGKKTDGASVIFNNIPFIVICPRFVPRMLFSLAHELGHILSHHRDRNFAVIDEEGLMFRSRKRQDEAFAHAFASELLMPQEGVGVTLRTIREFLKINGDFIGEVELLYLSRIYGVSFEVASLRCENLGIIPPGSSTSFYEQIVKDHKSPELRAQQLGLPEREVVMFPRVSSNLLDAAIEKIKLGLISLEKASELLNISAVDIINYNSSREWI